ncbi:MAG TPA: serine/threonine-protein kinase [Kofleriaceae bacterium]|nr:serine/threonine-protein kinase [Kofleriaceae bacterium]
MTASSSRSSVVKTGDIVERRYRILRTLGEGSLGVVFLAEHVANKRRVAVKLLRSELSADAAALDRFMAEARGASATGHPNIAQVVELGMTQDDVPFVVMEYLEGTLLTDEIYRVGGLPVRRALKLADKIASALEAVHDAGIVHRDLTSDNVFLLDRDDAFDVPKLLGFGMSRFLELPDDKARRGQVLGSPEYMAPEQLTGGASLDRRVDVYALGVILYEMLTARRPFSDDDRRALVHRVVHEPPPPLMRPEAPVGLELLILGKLLAKDPARRHGTMKEVRSALDAFATAMRPGSAIPVAVGQTASGPVRVAPGLPVPLLDLSSDDPTAISRAAEPRSTPPPAAPAGPRAVEPARPSEPSVPSEPSGPVELPQPAELVDLPALPGRRSARIAWLVAAMLAGGAGGALLYAEEQTAAAGDVAVTAALDADAEKLAALLDGEVRAARLRADGVAGMPMLRAAIETDAATLRDMVGTDFIFSPRPGEVLELFQLRDGAMTSMLRIPESGRPVAAVSGGPARIESDGAQITLVAGAPVAKQQAGVGGAVAISVPIDLAPIKRRLAEHVRSATLVGFGPAVPLCGAADAGETTITVALPLGQELGVHDAAIAAVVPAPPGQLREKLRVARLLCWGTGGILLVLYLANLLRARKRS